MNFKHHQNRQHHQRPHQRRQRQLFAPIIFIMSMANLSAAAPFASLKRMGTASLSSLSLRGHGASESAFVARHRYHARRPAIPRDANNILVSSDKRSISSIGTHMESIQALWSKTSPFTSFSWAMNAVAEANVQESQGDNKEINGGDAEVKVPAKFRPYPFPVSEILLLYQRIFKDTNFTALNGFDLSVS
mmetsp:Transcript_35140/g.63231  ORF Transcript_35140/g.63231 Transcript_35140/m.63231 type:complete len:190 (-) Transcript_35140:1488-2057(-)